ncbi:hypothetical protein E3N88_15554 [Mikania micrantha]|uniref:Uncharacterized protein n=1 Tax=Mikania micrantha TaxID=192012 RepID=A0A5N6NVY5_9ASTR|nr:hypothetical protein E3N88_15554 [Mikania micrantha]
MLKDDNSSKIHESASGKEAVGRCVNLLKDNQEKWVVKMGFGSLLNFMVDEIPGRLAHHVIDKFNDKKTVIRVRGQKIRVKEWKEQYEGHFVGASSLVENIQHFKDKNDFNISLNFVMMFVIFLVECTKNGMMKEDILKYFYHGTEFSQFDSC